eukprot:6939836-Prorocentrum_lima.AAC.1
MSIEKKGKWPRSRMRPTAKATVLRLHEGKRTAPQKRISSTKRAHLCASTAIVRCPANAS